jgi:hypothetical protein
LIHAAFHCQAENAHRERVTVKPQSFGLGQKIGESLGGTGFQWGYSKALKASFDRGSGGSAGDFGFVICHHKRSRQRGGIGIYFPRNGRGVRRRKRAHLFQFVPQFG